jgi:hypothetical protein
VNQHAGVMPQETRRGRLLSATRDKGGALLHRLNETRMSRHDAALWQYARTMADLGELVACWLEGSVASQPGYCGPSDIEDPALVPLLARLNRSGFVTTGSQIGEIIEGDGGTRAEQRAAVEGFAGPEMTSALILAADDAGVIAIVRDPASLPRWRYRYDRAVTVTTVNGRRMTGFGVQVPRSHIRSPVLGYGICHPDAVRALCEAWQVTVIDPEPGRNDTLWPALARALERKEGT